MSKVYEFYNSLSEYDKKKIILRADLFEAFNIIRDDYCKTLSASERNIIENALMIIKTELGIKENIDIVYKK